MYKRQTQPSPQTTARRSTTTTTGPNADEQAGAATPDAPLTQTFTTNANLLVPGNGTSGAQEPTTTTTAPAQAKAEADGTSRMIWMIIAALAAVAVLVALLTWRYWLLTRPNLHLDDPDDGGDYGPPGGYGARGGAVPPASAAGGTVPAPRGGRQGKPRRAPAEPDDRGRRRSGGGDPFWDDPGDLPPGPGAPGRSFAAPGATPPPGSGAGRPPGGSGQGRPRRSGGGQAPPGGRRGGPPPGGGRRSGPAPGEARRGAPPGRQQPPRPRRGEGPGDPDMWSKQPRW